MTSCILKMEIETAFMNCLSINIDMFGYLWIRDMASAYLSHSPIITNASNMLSLLLRLCFPCYYMAALFVLIIAASIVLSLSLPYVIFEHCYVCAIIATTVMILLLQYLLCLNLLLLSCFACFFCCFFTTLVLLCCYDKQ